MKLMPFEEVIKLLNEYPSSNTNKIIHGLPEPIDPIAIIDEMQEEYKKDPTVGDGSFDYDIEALLQDARYNVLQELKSRLYPLTQK